MTTHDELKARMNTWLPKGAKVLQEFQTDTEATVMIAEYNVGKSAIKSKEFIIVRGFISPYTNGGSVSLDFRGTAEQLIEKYAKFLCGDGQ